MEGCKVLLLYIPNILLKLLPLPFLAGQAVSFLSFLSSDVQIIGHGSCVVADADTVPYVIVEDFWDVILHDVGPVFGYGLRRECTHFKLRVMKDI